MNPTGQLCLLTTAAPIWQVMVHTRIICEELIQKYPNLQHKDFEHAEAPPGARSTFRLVVIDFQSSYSQVGVMCQRSRRARMAIDFSTVVHASRMRLTC